MKVLAFLTQENKAGKMPSTTNQLKHGKGCAVRDNGTCGLDRPIQHKATLMLYCYLDHNPHTIIARTALPSVLKLLHNSLLYTLPFVTIAPILIGVYGT